MPSEILWFCIKGFDHATPLVQTKKAALYKQKKSQERFTFSDKVSEDEEVTISGPTIFIYRK